MSKRFQKNGHFGSPAKKFKLTDGRDPSPKSPLTQNQNQKIGNAKENDKFPDDDIWGEEFADDVIQEIDFIASQAYTQEEPKTSMNVVGNSKFNLQSQIISGSSVQKEVKATPNLNFSCFENNIINDPRNSTFCPRSKDPVKSCVVVEDDEQLEQWKEEKKKLLQEFMVKDGETEYLRQQLQAEQMKINNMRKEKMQLIAQTEQDHQNRYNELMKKYELLVGDLESKNIRINNLAEKNKLLESGSIKFTSPQSSLKNNLKDKYTSLSNWSPQRKASTRESGVQVKKSYKEEYQLKYDIKYYPLHNISPSIFERPEVEKPVIDIKIEEKTGKKNLSILQDEKNLRIYENTQLARPKVTMINGKVLSTGFFLPEISELMKKTSNEINSLKCDLMIHKLIATTRELLLNTAIVLKNICGSLKDDDIRDMNELYLSDYYEMPVLHTKSICEAKSWYEKERGIESRRALGILAEVAIISKYLANYIAGKKKLNIQSDPHYKCYAEQLESYKEWNKKCTDFELLELILDLISTINAIRRSHQFSGLIIAVLKLLINVQQNVGFCPIALQKVHQIITEVIFSRPLLICFKEITQAITIFSNPQLFQRLCVTNSMNEKIKNPRLKSEFLKREAITYWKGTLNFTPVACPLEVLLIQLQAFKLDPITAIEITKSLSSFTLTSLLKNLLPWDIDKKMLCECCLSLLKFLIEYLCQCIKFNIENLRKKYLNSNLLWRTTKNKIGKEKLDKSWNNELYEDWSNFERINTSFWIDLKIQRSEAISSGIRILRLIARRNISLIMRLTEIEDAFHQFLLYLNERQNLDLSKCDVSALKYIEQAPICHRTRDSEEKNKSKFEPSITKDSYKFSWVIYGTKKKLKDGLKKLKL